MPVPVENIIIRNDNPDKGTETMQCAYYLCYLISLEMITPIRGRKHLTALSMTSTLIIRNDNPDKGTETIKNIHSEFLTK